MTISEILALPDGIEKAKQLAIYGLLTDEWHHKQWFLEEILKSLKVDLNELRKELQRDGYDWQDGVAP